MIELIMTGAGFGVIRPEIAAKRFNAQAFTE
jgi:hypothetical protein